MSSPLAMLTSEVSHVAHFYDRVETHVDDVADYLADALSGDAGVLIVARGANTERLRRAVSSRGIDVGDAVRGGRLVAVDADALLAEIRRGTSLDLDRFETVAEAALVDAAGGKRVRVYGELVSLLWEAGDIQGAIDIEDAWIRLAERVEFSLVCGYDAASMSSDQIDGFHDLCGRHADVIGAPPMIEDAECARRFPGAPAALRPVRRFVASALSAWGLDQLIGDALLVVGELATNAVMHARSDFNVALTRSDRAVRLSVGDASDVLPRLSQPTVDGIGGHGMHVVAKLASATGHEVSGGGKVIWAELDLPSGAPVAV